MIAFVDVEIAWPAYFPISRRITAIGDHLGLPAADCCDFCILGDFA
jgi:hypothetical protein